MKRKDCAARRNSREVNLPVYVQIAFHGDKAEEVGQHSVRLPKDSHVRELLSELRNLLPPAYSNRPLRLLEIYMSKIYKVPVSLPQQPCVDVLMHPLYSFGTQASLSATLCRCFGSVLWLSCDPSELCHSVLSWWC